MKPTREEILNFFVELLGPHLDPDVIEMSDEELYERYQAAKEELENET